MTDLKSMFEQKHRNREATDITVPQAFTNKFPDLKADKANKLFARYVASVIGELMNKLPFLHDGETHVSTEKLFNACGSFEHKKTRYFVWNEFKAIYPLMVELRKGSNLHQTDNPFEKNTRVKIVNERLLTMILEGKTPQEVFDHFYKEVDLSAAADEADRLGVTGHVNIDMMNLERFIGSTYVELEQAQINKLNDNFIRKLQRNIWQAEIVHRIGRYTQDLTGDEAVLPMVPAPSAFGRVYYKGMNIQNVTKEVRSAIIGHHFQYDMNAAVFAIKLHLYGIAMGGDNEIVNTPYGTYTRQYLAEKDAIRKRLARECYDGIDLPQDARIKAIKNALTSIGFGAKPTGKTWFSDGQLQGTALADILVAPDARQAFLNDNWVKKFIAEQKDMEDVILEAVKADPAYEEMERIVREASKNGKVDRAGLLALIYQHKETEFMDDAVAVLNSYGIKPIARIHDAFIVGEKLSAKVLDDIHVAWGLKGYLSMDCDEAKEWVDPSYKLALIQSDKHIVEHRERMAKVEQQAALYRFRMQQMGGVA